jgi:uncharacterized protein
MMSDVVRTGQERSGKGEQLAVWFAVLFPSLVTWVYFVALAEHPATWQQGAYGLGKTIQFAFPAIWACWFCRSHFGWPQVSGTVADWLIGILFGVVVVGTMYAVYRIGLDPAAWFEPVRAEIRDKIAGFGVSSVAAYVGLAVFYSLVHSGLEEYYWRWFVFGRMRTFMTWPWALVVSSLGFMAHHVILLIIYFGATSVLAYVFSLGVAIGGAFWAWSYHRSGSLIVPWLSHLLVDAGIFWIGYEIASDLLAGT